ncbi:hypothetical protein OAH18_03110 [bacterium]|nr:hypothetical protein [bacterium]
MRKPQDACIFSKHTDGAVHWTGSIVGLTTAVLLHDYGTQATVCRASEGTK